MKRRRVNLTVTKNCRSDALKDRAWSYTSVSAYETCPAMFKYLYIDHVPRAENAFSQWGSLCHSIFERYNKHELELYEMLDVYNSEYDSKVTQKFPESDFIDLNWFYRNKGVEVFSGYEGLSDRYEVVAVEQKVEQVLHGYKFVGSIDLLLRDKEDGKLIIQDYKSKSKFKNKAEQAAYARQLYLYSGYVVDNYFENPKLLRFDMFRTGKVVDIPFSVTDFGAATDWFISTIDAIFADETFERKCDEYFCDNICSAREKCCPWL